MKRNRLALILSLVATVGVALSAVACKNSKNLLQKAESFTSETVTKEQWDECLNYEIDYTGYSPYPWTQIYAEGESRTDGKEGKFVLNADIREGETADGAVFAPVTHTSLLIQSEGVYAEGKEKSSMKVEDYSVNSWDGTDSCYQVDGGEWKSGTWLYNAPVLSGWWSGYEFCLYYLKTCGTFYGLKYEDFRFEDEKKGYVSAQDGEEWILKFQNGKLSYAILQTTDEDWYGTDSGIVQTVRAAYRFYGEDREQIVLPQINS